MKSLSTGKPPPIPEDGRRSADPDASDWLRRPLGDDEFAPPPAMVRRGRGRWWLVGLGVVALGGAGIAVARPWSADTVTPPPAAAVAAPPAAPVVAPTAPAPVAPAPPPPAPLPSPAEPPPAEPTVAAAAAAPAEAPKVPRPPRHKKTQKRTTRRPPPTP